MKTTKKMRKYLQVTIFFYNFAAILDYKSQKSKDKRQKTKDYLKK